MLTIRHDLIDCEVTTRELRDYEQLGLDDALVGRIDRREEYGRRHGDFVGVAYGVGYDAGRWLVRRMVVPTGAIN
jgi:hypothetical protein